MIGSPFYSSTASTHLSVASGRRRMNRCSLCNSFYLATKYFPIYVFPFLTGGRNGNGTRRGGSLIVCNSCNEIVQPDREQPEMISKEVIELMMECFVNQEGRTVKVGGLK